MRRIISLAALCLLASAGSSVAAPATGDAVPRTHAASALSTLTRALSGDMKEAGSYSSADVVDLTTGQQLFSAAASTPRLPASVEKLYTTSTALLRFGPGATLTTDVYGVGKLTSTGTWDGDLYLRGGGDPTFGSQSYDKYAYGGGATMQQLVLNLKRATGITAVHGSIYGDESYFDADRGTPATDNQPNAYVEGQLSGLAYDRGLADTSGSTFQARPALFAAQAFASALEAAHVSVPASDTIAAGVTPRSAAELTAVHSPSMATLIKWTNTPSDNFFAETLLKDLGARFGAGGTTAAGVGVVKAELAKEFGIRPSFNDGSGLSYSDHSTVVQVETLLAKMATNPSFVSSLAIAGETGTLVDEMRGTDAQGKCRAKTGTLSSVANLAGYCTAANGDNIAFAFLFNKIDPDNAHPISDAMAEAIAAYSG